VIATSSQHPIAVVITIGLAMAASPFGVLAVVVMLGTTKPLANAWSFTAGWMVSITTVGLLTAWLLQRNEQTSSGSSSGSAVIHLLLGAALLIGGIVAWRKRHDPRRSGPPKWLRRIDGVQPFVAFGLGLFLPTWALIAPVVDQITGAGFTRGEAIGVFAVFVVVASLGLLLPTIVYTVRREWAASMLSAWRAWLLENAGAVVAVLLIVLGVLFLVRGVVAAT
jgi:hypothetical protein